MKKVILLILLLPLSLLACATANHLPSVNSVVYHPESRLETSSLSPSTIPSDRNLIPSDRSLVTVTWTCANIRSGVGHDYPVVKFVQQGDKLVLIGESGNWFNVRFENGQQGWISNRVVK